MQDSAHPGHRRARTLTKRCQAAWRFGAAWDHALRPLAEGVWILDQAPKDNTNVYVVGDVESARPISALAPHLTRFRARAAAAGPAVLADAVDKLPR